MKCNVRRQMLMRTDHNARQSHMRTRTVFGGMHIEGSFLVSLSRSHAITTKARHRRTVSVTTHIYPKFPKRKYPHYIVNWKKIHLLDFDQSNISIVVTQKPFCYTIPLYYSHLQFYTTLHHGAHTKLTVQSTVK